VRRAAAITAAVVVTAVAFVLAAVETGDAVDRRDLSLGPRLDDVVAAGVPGALAYVDDGSAELRVARGAANLETGASLRATDRFRAGSITKTFVAAVVLQLAAEGRLDLDAPVASWLPGLVPRGITVRQLLSHRSGLADYVDDRGIVSEPVSSHRALTEQALARAPVAEPGERYSYASTNYLVLGLLVERVTGNELGDELRERIIGPLALVHTTFEPGVTHLRVHGYRPGIHDGIVSGDPRDTDGESAAWAWAAGALVSDAGDLARFLEALVSGRVVPAPLLDEMIPARGYGLGLAAFTTPCGPAIGHTGNLGGYVSAAWTDPRAEHSVVVMANSYPLTPEADTAVHRALDAAFCGVSG
jgi:D-alanyl-D-alanine carboxypeptidase